MLKTLQKAQKGFTIIELLIVIAIIAILAGLVLNNFQGAQAKARDTQTVTRANALHSKLEEFYNEANAYPNTVTDATWFPGIDAKSLTDSRGGDIQVELVAAVGTGNTTPAGGTAVALGADAQYRYYVQPAACTTTASASGGTVTYTLGATPCTGYKILSKIEKPTATTTDPYGKVGLQNP